MTRISVDQFDAARAYVATPANLLWDDLRVSLNRATIGSNNPSLTPFLTTLQAYAFSKTLIQQLYFDVQLPHAWAYGTTVSPHIHWSPGTSQDTGVVRWGLEYSIANYGAVFPATTTITVEQAGSGVAYAHQIAELPDIVMTGKKASSLIMCRIFREGNHVNDTFDAEAFGLSIDFHLQYDKDGGLTEYAGAV